MFQLGQDSLTCSILVKLSQSVEEKIAAGSHAIAKLNHFRAIVENNILKEGRTVYGINTGFGYLSDVKIPDDQLQQLQLNLIRSHACGVGEFLPPEIVRSLLISRAHCFLLGHSGVSKAVVETILQFLKFDILPMVPSQGSVGACGDLAPLAHLALGLIGEGDCLFEGKQISVSQALKKTGVSPLKPEAKEGLALINGTQVMTAIAAQTVIEAKNLIESATYISSLSLDAMRGTNQAFDKRIHSVRPHPGQKVISAKLNEIFSEHDEIIASHNSCGKVQDPYSFRCIPQVHGASLDTLQYVESIVDRELNSITDNPLVFENGDIISGGNFHGQPVALACDFLKIAMSEIGSISECRIETLTNPALSGLPPFIIENSGLNSGFMIPHVVAASLASENKGLSHPSSVDSIPTSADKEDHVSMGTTAARTAAKINDNVAKILSIELLAGCQGIDLLKPHKPGPTLYKIYEKVRSFSDFLNEDRSLHLDIEEMADRLLRGELLSWV